MPRTRQVNIRLDDVEFELLEAAANAEEIKLSVWIRDAALEAAAPVDPEPEAGQHLPSWLAALLLYVHAIRGGQGKPDAVDAANAAGVVCRHTEVADTARESSTGLNDNLGRGYRHDQDSAAGSR